MKKLLSLMLTLLFISSAVKAEEVPLKDAIKWSYKVEYLDNNEAYVIAHAKLSNHFHLFSLVHDDMAYDFTGTPTTLNFEKSDKYSLIGKVRENKPTMGSDDVGTYVWHEKEGIFKQKIKILSSSDFKINFTVDWQVCNDVMCHIPQSDEVSLTISPKAKVSNVVEPTTTVDEAPTSDDADATEVEEVAAEISNGTCAQPVELSDFPVSLGIRAIAEDDSMTYEVMFVLKAEEGWKSPANKEGKLNGLSITLKDGKNYRVEGELIAPDSIHTYFDSILNTEVSYYPNNSVWKQVIKTNSKDAPIINGNMSLTALSNDSYLASETKNFVFNLKDAKPRIQDDKSSESYWSIFIIAFLSGFAALLTPCVFPMIPMTVSFFTKQSKTKSQGIRNAIIYAISIIAIYVALGLGVTLAFGADALNSMSTNVYFNIFFFILLVIFGASFLGAFEIRMPSKWINKADQNADKGGLIGIFFMAFTLSLVSFSCTGPIIGTLLVEAVDKGVMGPFFGMLGFSLALALPFALFAMFPGWLNSLPQSGGWLNSVKVVLGLLEIALAFKFLSNADLVVQAHLIEREVFLAIWIVLFAMIGFYLIGKLMFSHDSPLPFISTPRIFMSIIVFAFVVYMVPGMWGAPVKLLSGFLPPQHYSEIPYGINGKPEAKKLPEHAYSGPHGILYSTTRNTLWNMRKKLVSQ